MLLLNFSLMLDISAKNEFLKNDEMNEIFEQNQLNKNLKTKKSTT